MALPISRPIVEKCLRQVDPKCFRVKMLFNDERVMIDHLLLSAYNVF